MIPGYLRVLLRLAVLTLAPSEGGCVEWDGKPSSVFGRVNWNDIVYLSMIGAIDLEVKRRGRRRVGGRACIRAWVLEELREDLCEYCSICQTAPSQPQVVQRGPASIAD